MNRRLPRSSTRPTVTRTARWTSRNGRRRHRPLSRRTSSSWQRRTVTNLASWPSKQSIGCDVHQTSRSHNIYVLYCQPKRGHHVLSVMLQPWNRASSRLIGTLKRNPKEARNPNQYNHHHHTTHVYSPLIHRRQLRFSRSSK